MNITVVTVNLLLPDSSQNSFELAFAYNGRRRRIVAMWYINRKREKRKYWMHPIISERNEVGTFRTLISELRSNEIKFYHFRLSIRSFDDLIVKV